MLFEIILSWKTEDWRKNKEKLMVVGDMNAHLEELDGRSNKNGEKLRRLKGCRNFVDGEWIGEMGR